jgi:hypothetical protein
LFRQSCAEKFRLGREAPTRGLDHGFPVGPKKLGPFLNPEPALITHGLFARFVLLALG